MADFELVAKRTLTLADYRLFRMHFLLGADWKLFQRQVGIRRGNFLQGVYRIEPKLGEAFASLEPYALYPPREYFAFRLAEAVKPTTPAFIPARPVAKVIPIRGPRAAQKRTA